jgi:hypothetical protein
MEQTTAMVPAVAAIAAAEARVTTTATATAMMTQETATAATTAAVAVMTQETAAAATAIVVAAQEMSAMAAAASARTLQAPRWGFGWTRHRHHQHEAIHATSREKKESSSSPPVYAFHPRCQVEALTHEHSTNTARSRKNTQFRLNLPCLENSKYRQNKGQPQSGKFESSDSNK